MILKAMRRRMYKNVGKSKRKGKHFSIYRPEKKGKD
jgi:hypothetical protein